MNKLFALILIVIIPAGVNAEDDFLSTFVIGKYLLIGQGIDTKETYSGNVSIYLENSQLKVKRIINEKVTIGQANFKSVLNGDSKVLRIQFSDNGVNFEETCLFSGDLDNYARISCYLYIPDTDITKPGMEALFIDRSLN